MTEPVADSALDAPPEVQARIRRDGGGRARFFIVESFVVVLSVLIALGLDKWSEERERRGLAEAAMSEVVAEVVLNLEELVRTDSITRSRLASLGELASSVDGSRPLFSYAPPGFYTPDLNRAAYERLSRSAVEFRVPSSFTNDAFRFYRGVEMMAALETRVQDIYFGPLQHRAEDARVSLAVSQALMRQQLAWGDYYREVATDFLETWGAEAVRDAVGR